MKVKINYYPVVFCNICHKTLTRIEKLIGDRDLTDKIICSNCLDCIDYNSKGVIL